MGSTTSRTVLVADRYRVDVRLLAGAAPAVGVDALTEAGRVVRLVRPASCDRAGLQPVLTAWNAAVAAGLPLVAARGLVEDAAVGPVLVLGPHAGRPLHEHGIAATLAAQACVYGAALAAAGVPVDGLGADDLGVADDGSLLFHTPPWRGSPAWAPEDLPRPDTAAQVEHLVAVVRSACPSNATAAVPAPDARRRPGRTWRRRRPAVAGAGRASDPGGPTAAVAAAPGLAGADRPPWHGLPAAPAEIPRRGSAGPSLVALRVVCMTLLVVLVVVLALGDRLTPTGAAAPRSATSAWPTAAGPSIAPAGSPVVTPHGPRRPASEPTRARSVVAPGVRPAGSRPRDGVASRVGLQRPSAGRLGNPRGTRAAVRGGAAERRAADVEAGPRGRGRATRPVRPVRPRRFGPAGAPDRDGRPRPAGVARAARRSGGAVSPRARSRPGRRADGPRRDDHGGLLAGPGLGG